MLFLYTCLVSLFPCLLIDLHCLKATALIVAKKLKDFASSTW